MKIIVDQWKYADIKEHVCFICFRPETSYWKKVVPPNYQISYKL